MDEPGVKRGGRGKDREKGGLMMGFSCFGVLFFLFLCFFSEIPHFCDCLQGLDGCLSFSFSCFYSFLFLHMQRSNEEMGRYNP